FKDYISIPKKNNYQSIHNTVIGPEGKLVEIQIRTRKMHEIAEKGVAAHWKYKENLAAADRDLEDWVNWIRDVFENVNKYEATKEILASFKLNLYQDEIYIFSPKGDLKRLPIDSTPVDFAYEIHSRVGFNCIGAKVNGKIVPLDTKLNSGDQVEIITSKNQHPNKGWLKFVKTHKAKQNIRKFLNKEEERLVEAGKEVWEKKLKKLKMVFDKDDFNKLIRKLKFENSQKFFMAVFEEKINLDEILAQEQQKDEKENSELTFDSFATLARSTAGGVIVEGEFKGIEYKFAKGNNPIPGDPIVGFITIGEGIKIHRKDCKNLLTMAEHSSDKIITVQW
ncbi:MAG: bifunctional (p)ppGpp synthetase/guanosine-3',5'-bis(diphosphate) 3'-pyrophosphohydrolase, partial [Melioribacteraceae bacterium]